MMWFMHFQLHVCFTVCEKEIKACLMSVRWNNLSEGSSSYKIMKIHVYVLY